MNNVNMMNSTMVNLMILNHRLALAAKGDNPNFLLLPSNQNNWLLIVLGPTKSKLFGSKIESFRTTKGLHFNILALIYLPTDDVVAVKYSG
jgi:hypothetical protein